MGARELATERTEDSLNTDCGRIIDSNFRPPAGLAGEHLQTLLGGILPVMRRPRIRRERWELPDGDFLDLDWIGTSSHAPWALILPGIVGNLRSPYAMRAMKRFAAAGYRAGLLNYRGLSGAPNRLVTAYHAGFTQDLDLVVRHLAARHGPGLVVGYSMGGNLLLKWLGETGTGAAIKAAAAVSVPFRLAPAADKMFDGEAEKYGRYLLKDMRRLAQRKFSRLPPPFSIPSLAELRSLREFDEHITAPLHGFAGADDYYERASCLPFLRRIAVPTLIVNALDDAFIPRETLPGPKDLSSSVTLELSAHGGHVGFVGRGRFGLPRFWLNDRLVGFLADPQ